MAKFLHIQQFGKPLNYIPELQTMLSKLGFTLLSNGQTYQQFSQKATFKNFPSDAWLTDMFPEKPLVNIDALKDLDVGFSGVYLHKMRFSADLFRDYFGIKQLYYWYKDNLLIASNDQMAILASLPSTPKPDGRTIKSYLNGREELKSATFFEGIHRVLPGERINFSILGIEKSYFWPVENIPSKEQNATSYFESLKYRVARLSGGNKKIYVAINGGIHSAIVASLLSNKLSKEIKGIFYSSNYSKPFHSNRAHAVAVVHDFDLIKTTGPDEAVKSIQYLTALTTRPLSPISKPNAFLTILKKAQGGTLYLGHGGYEMSQSFEFYKRTLVQKQDFDQLKKALFNGSKYRAEKEDLEVVFIHELYSLLSGSLFQKLALILLIPQVNKPSILRFIKRRLRIKHRPLQTVDQARPISSELNSTLEMLDIIGNQLKVKLAFPFLTKEEIKTEMSEETQLLKMAAAELLPKIFQEDSENDLSHSDTPETKKLIKETLHLFGEKHPVWDYIDKIDFQNDIAKIEENRSNYEEEERLLRKIYLAIWFNEFYA